MPRRSSYPLAGSPVSGNAEAAVVRAPAVDFRGLAQGVADIAAAAGEINQRLDRRQDAINAGKAELDFQKNVLGALDQEDPAAPDYQARVDQLIADARTQAIDAHPLSGADAAAELETRLGRAGLAVQADALRRRAAAVDAAAEDMIVENTNTLISSIRNDPDNAAVYMQEFRARWDATSGAIPAAKRPRIEQLAQKEAFRAQVEGLAERGDIKSARTLLSSDAGKSLLDRSAYVGAQSTIDRAEREQERERSNLQNAAIRDVSLAVAKGQLSRENVEALEARGLFEGKENALIALYSRFEARDRMADRAERAADRKALAEERQALARERADDRLLAAGGFDGYAQQRLFADQFRGTGGDADKAIAQYGETMGKWGVAPWIAREVSAGEHSADPAVLAKAAERASAIDQVAPGVNTGAGARVEAVQALADATGVGFDAAAQQVLATAPRDNKEQEARASEVRKYIASQFGGAAGLAEEALGSSSAAANPALQYRAASAFERFYQVFGDPEKALEATKRSLTRTGVGSTTTSGVVTKGEKWESPVVFKPKEDASSAAAPEVVWRGLTDLTRNLDPDAFGAMLREHVGAKLVDLGIADGAEFQLIPSADAAARRREGRPIAYNIVVTRDDQQTLVYAPTPGGGRAPAVLEYPGDEELMATGTGKRLREAANLRAEQAAHTTAVGRAVARQAATVKEDVTPAPNSSLEGYLQSSFGKVKRQFSRDIEDIRTSLGPAAGAIEEFLRRTPEGASNGGD